MNDNFRYLARILIEAATPLKIGTGESGLTIDEIIARDANGLPTIPGTALAGVLRHTVDLNEKNKIFGYQNKSEGIGSRVIISNAQIVGKEDEVLDGLQIIDFSDSFYGKFKKLPIRDHVRINEFGVADKKGYGKYDSQVVFKGTRFVFHLELIGNSYDRETWQELITTLRSPLFRIGGGTRKGFGELEVIKIDQSEYNLSEKTQLEKYLDRSSRLTVPKSNGGYEKGDSDKIVKYRMKLTANDFFLFSSGNGDTDVDMVPKKEQRIAWGDNGKPYFTNEEILIPASSVKGAIAHRTAFHYNLLNKIFADEVDNIDKYVGENNHAVKALFGYAKYSDNSKDYGQRGRVLISDVYLSKTKEKIFNHVAIDRFTGGAINGALFDERVAYTDEIIELNISVEKEAFSDEKVQESFEAALKDIGTGMLPLGGGVMRGHGSFSGKLFRDQEEII